MSPQELSFVIEAWLFTHAQPLTLKELKRLVRKANLLADDTAEVEEATASPAEHEADVELEASDEADASQTQRQAEAPLMPQGAASEASSAVEDTLAQDADEPFALTPPSNEPRGRPVTLQALLREAIAMLHLRWHDPDHVRGIQLMTVGEGLTFKTNPRYAAVVRALREDKPPRLTRPALESLAIVAYRQPVTKPDIDQLRGVDSGGVVKMLLERGFIAVIGKREEPGRPLMYGTTPTFLQFFNLSELDALPSLKQFDELNDEAAQALRAFEGLPSLKELSEGATQIRLDDDSQAQDLDDVVQQLNRRESRARQALISQGVAFDPHSASPPSDQTHH